MRVYKEWVEADFYDVEWKDGGIGTHGKGPFLTEYQAKQCLTGAVWPGNVVRLVLKVPKGELQRLMLKAKHRRTTVVPWTA
jgi:hypothetical protein